MVVDRRTSGLHEEDVVAAYTGHVGAQLAVGEPLQLARRAVGIQRGRDA